MSSLSFLLKVFLLDFSPQCFKYVSLSSSCLHFFLREIWCHTYLCSPVYNMSFCLPSLIVLNFLSLVLGNLIAICHGIFFSCFCFGDHWTSWILGLWCHHFGNIFIIFSSNTHQVPSIDSCCLYIRPLEIFPQQTVALYLLLIVCSVSFYVTSVAIFIFTNVFFPRCC